MRSLAVLCLLACCLACGGAGRSFTAPAGTTVQYAVTNQVETRTCESPVTPQATCRITLSARVLLGELEGRPWRIDSVRSVVRDQTSGQDLRALPATLTAEDVRLVAGTNVLPAHGSLTIPVQVQFLVSQKPYYVDGPHELLVTLVASVGGTS